MDVSDAKRRMRILIAAVAGFIIVIVTISVIMILRGQENSDGEVEATPGLVFKNSGFASRIFGETLFGLVSGDIESIVKNEAEEAGTFAETYEAEINNSGVASKVSFPYSISSFEFKVSDGREYSVKIAANMPSYYGILVLRDKPKQNIPKMKIVFLGSGDRLGYDREKVISNLLKWAKGFSSDGVYLTTKNTF